MPIADKDFCCAGAELGLLTRGAGANGAGSGATDGAAIDPTAPCCPEDCKSAEDKSEERLGRVELGTIDGGADVTPALGNSDTGGTDDTDGDGAGLACK